MPEKIGVYICSGCGIGEALDVAALAKVARSEFKAAAVETHPHLCSAEGLALIRKDLEAEPRRADKLVIAACSPRAKTEAFAFDRRILVERVNLREHVAWSQPPGEDDTQMMAEDYLRMGIVRAQKGSAPEPVSETISRKILVVGGGIAGLTAALEAAAAGYEVLLVEKEAQLGGFLGAVKRRFPADPPYHELAADGVKSKIEQVLYHPKIRVWTSARIVRTAGQPGQFDVTLETASGTVTDRAGAIVLATGWKPYDATRLAHLGYGLSRDVVTNVELERMAAAGPLRRPSDGKPVGEVLFVQCAGSRDARHLPYCSSVCCLATLKQARYIREANPDAKVFIVYKDMRTPGQYERFYRSVQDDPLNFLTKGEVSAVVKRPDGKLGVTVTGTPLGAELVLNVDLVVLATGMTPNAADGPAIRELKDNQLKVLQSESAAQRAEAARRVEELKIHEGTEILNLEYRQGPDLPALKYGFPDSHFVCFPYETRRTGIYAAGAVRAPMDGARAEQDALGAAMKAIQAIEMAARGEAVHPRAGDLAYPSFFLQRCTQCKRCTEECPFGSLNEDAKGTPQFNVFRCRRCGICMGACPERIINFPNYSVDMIASMIKAIEVPDEFEEKPRILVFMCENDAYPALDIAGLNRRRHSPFVRIIPLRCLGSLNIVWIADALSRGIDGILLVGCKFGENYQCHYATGSELANRRLANVKETLERLRLEPERLRLEQLAINESGRLVALLDEFAAAVAALGPNPYKGF